MWGPAPRTPQRPLPEPTEEPQPVKVAAGLPLWWHLKRFSRRKSPKLGFQTKGNLKLIKLLLSPSTPPKKKQKTNHLSIACNTFLSLEKVWGTEGLSLRGRGEGGWISYVKHLKIKHSKLYCQQCLNLEYHLQLFIFPLISPTLYFPAPTNRKKLSVKHTGLLSESSWRLLPADSTSVLKATAT